MIDKYMTNIKEKPYYITALELSELNGKLPNNLRTDENLVYSSEATLSYNSPGAQGFGVKRAGLAIPESVMLLLSPACCGRNTTILADGGGYSDKIFFMQVDENDLVTGRYLDDIPKAAKEIVNTCRKRGKEPKVIVICTTCVDALLGTDVERLCRKAEDEAGVKVIPTYMYALMREGNNPPMVSVRESVYSLLEKRSRDERAVNLMGFFSDLDDKSEIYDLLSQIGMKKIRQISRCNNYSEYIKLGEANFNLVLNPEARRAADMLYRKLGIPMIELTRLYQIDRIKKQYMLMGAALGVEFDDERYYIEAANAIESMLQHASNMKFAIGQVINGNPLELALALSKYGLDVRSVFTNFTDLDMHYINELKDINPDIRIYSPLSPSMINYDIEDGKSNVDISIGRDALFYYPESINVEWSDEIQPFGYMGLLELMNRITEAVRFAGE